MTTLAEQVLAAVARYAAGPVFGLPGVHNLPFWRAAGGPRIVVPRHEQTAGYAADAAARATGRLGVALTTTGPGATNALTAFGEAAASNSRLLLVASEVSTTLTGTRALHAMPGSEPAQVELFRPLAVAAYAPRTLDEAVAATADAIATAAGSPGGPVYLGIPTDLLGLPAPAIEVTPVTVPPPAGDAVAAAARVLDRAQRVVVWAGGGAADAGPALAEVAERLRAPVVTTFAGRGVIPTGHPLAVDLPPHEPAVADLIGGADALLVVGSDLDGTTTRNWTMPRPAALVRIDAAAHRLHVPWPADAAIHADAAAGLDALAGALAPRPGPPPDLSAVAAARARLGSDPATAAAMTLVTAVDAATAALPQPPAVVCDMAVAGYWVGGYAAAQAPRRLLYPVGWGTLGFALPASVGAAAAAGPTLVVTGDAGALFGIGDLATLAEQRLPVTVLVVDDDGYGMLRFDQDRAGDPHRGVDLASPDFCALAGAFGVPARRADLGPDLGTALAEALSAGAPRLITVKAALVPPRTTSPRWRDPV